MHKTTLTFSFERDNSDEDGESWKGLRGQRMSQAWVLCPTPCVLAGASGRGSSCIQAASLIGEAGLACRPDESGESSRRGVTMNGKCCRGARDGREGLGNYPGFRVRHLPVHLLHLGNNNLSKASKGVHVILVTPEKTSASLLGNVCFSSMRHLF